MGILSTGLETLPDGTLKKNLVFTTNITLEHLNGASKFFRRAQNNETVSIDSSGLWISKVIASKEVISLSIELPNESIRLNNADLRQIKTILEHWTYTINRYR